jgi:hypothetical protein
MKICNLFEVSLFMGKAKWLVMVDRNMKMSMDTPRWRPASFAAPKASFYFDSLFLFFQYLCRQYDHPIYISFPCRNNCGARSIVFFAAGLAIPFPI